jgi:Patatin phospholipase
MRPLACDGNARDFDFSRATVRARWDAGYADTRKMLDRRPWEAAIDPATDLTFIAPTRQSEWRIFVGIVLVAIAAPAIHSHDHRSAR